MAGTGYRQSEDRLCRDGRAGRLDRRRLRSGGIRRDLHRAMAGACRGDPRERHHRSICRRARSTPKSRAALLPGGGDQAERSISSFSIVKAYDTKWVTQMVEPILADGWLRHRPAERHDPSGHRIVVGAERTIGAVIEIASNMFVPGVTNRQNDQEESWFALGAVDPGQQHRVEDVAKLLRCSGRVEVTDDIKSCKWMKLVVNAAELIPSAHSRSAAQRCGAHAGIPRSDAPGGL